MMKRLRTPLATAYLAAVLLLCSPAKVSAQESRTLLPSLFGGIRARFETDTQTGDLRFRVNHARLGAKGQLGAASGLFRYQFQADLNADGKLSILDTYASYASGPFEVLLGQQLNRFGTEWGRGAKLNYFASNSFLATYVGSYYMPQEGNAAAAAGNLGARDIGLLLRYNGSEKMPVGILAGLFNGYGTNNMTWHRNVNFVARVWIDPGTILDGFGIAGSYYTGRTPLSNAITMAGGELRYIKERWIVEGEYASRWLRTDAGTDRLDLAVVHAIYRQPVRNWGPIRFIAPMARWDYARNIALLEGNDILHLNAQRATGGITIGFAQKLLQCELRLNYEHYFLGSNPAAAVKANPVFHDKFIAEFYIAF
jgi:hypothetical protein